MRSGRIVAIEPHIAAEAPEKDVDGRLVVPGLVETHIHLDKACILDRCCSEQGTLEEAIAEVAAVKARFTEEDVYERGRRTLEKAILQGTTHMRTHVEVDPRVGLRSFNAIRALAADYRWAVDLVICVFPQEGLINDPGTEELIVEACEQGADLIGGCPYTDTAPIEHIDRIFALARRFDLDIDFHLDFDLDPSWMHLDEVCRQTERHRWGGRVAIGHATKLSAIDGSSLAAIGRRLADVGCRGHRAACDRPVSDGARPRAFGPARRRAGARSAKSRRDLLARDQQRAQSVHAVRRLLAHPHGQLYANVARLGRAKDIADCLTMVTTLAARLMNLPDYGIAVGGPADLVVLDCSDAVSAVAELAQPLLGIKNGRNSFTRNAAVLNRPRDGVGAAAPKDEHT